MIMVRNHRSAYDYGAKSQKCTRTSFRNSHRALPEDDGRNIRVAKHLQVVRDLAIRASDPGETETQAGRRP